MSVHKKIRAWTADAQLTRLLATDVSRAQQLDRRPKNSGAINIAHQTGALKMGAELLMASDRLDNSGTSNLPGYGVVNLKSSYALTKDWTLQARVENIFEKSYALATYAGSHFATPGVSAYVTLRYVPH